MEPEPENPTKLVKITRPEHLDHLGDRFDVSDGIGGRHKHNAVVTLPAEIADALIGAKMAVFADDSSRIEAERANKTRMDAVRLAEQKRAAENRMNLHDALPEPVRAAVQELGDQVAHDYIDGLPKITSSEGADTVGPAPVKRGPGRPRKEMN